MDLLGFVDEVKRLGGDGFEVFPDYLDASDPGKHLQEVADKAESLGLRISSVIAKNDFAACTAVQRAEQVEAMKGWIRRAAAAGIRRLNTFTGWHTDCDDPIVETYRVIDSYREVVSLAEENNILLCLENHSSVCPDADGILGIIRAVGSEALRTNPDFTNFVPEFVNRSDRARERIYAETRKFAPLAANAHLKVGEFTQDGGHPHVDMPRLMKILRDACYDGHVVLEVYGRHDPTEACSKGIALLRKSMG
jgi:sugar phosphate isomerase/epimerase